MNSTFSLSQLKQHDTSRLKGYRELLDFYNGRHWEGYPRYGDDHPLHEGRYLRRGYEVNHVRVEGYDNILGEKLLVDCFAWDDIDRRGDNIRRIEDRNIGSLSQAGERGAAELRNAEMNTADGLIRVSPNCAQQLYDVVGLSDPAAGLNGERRRVAGITLSYKPLRREYEMQLALGEV